MTGRTDTRTAFSSKIDPDVLFEGIVSGLIGAVTIALWFLLADSLQGRPFYTPSVLGTAMFSILQGGWSASHELSVQVSFWMVLTFSIIHGITLLGFGLLCAWLLDLAERDGMYAFNVAFLMVFFALGFTFLNMILAGVVLNALSITDIMIAHLLAVATMGTYYWRRHAHLSAVF